ncbi:MAG: 7-carboxy-7-deazaguanine synthase QueE, partial [bacterium]
ALVRVAGCNLCCVWCDTPYASRPGISSEPLTPAQIVSRIRTFPKTRHVVLTGGEPMLALGLPELARCLRDAGFHLTIETNATLPPASIACDLASLSPKLAHAFPSDQPVHAPDPAIIQEWLDAYACQLKFVIVGAADLSAILALLERLPRPPPPDRVLLMPRGATRQELARHRRPVAELCKQHGFRYCPRLHIELYGGRRGV